ncbi:unnamed protein product [Polarella glacialis]|uniref:Calcineurin-like phosphoesterase domain-containing protein n=1 Tax=Polarella glacialis TaxID=89957 RepID=A0A813D102_POLGL|nr:unnamed protein product [Polarella glacialis]CAE8650785.1 unnamed protein product [Polarella glacialis]
MSTPGALLAADKSPPLASVRYVKLPLDVSQVHAAEELIHNAGITEDGRLVWTSSGQTDPGSPSSRLCEPVFERYCRLVVVSDTHDLHSSLPRPLPKGDVLLHCGDFCNEGTDAEWCRFDSWIAAQALAVGCGDRVFCVAGNHDGPRRRHGMPRSAALPSANLLEAQLAKKKLLASTGLRLFGLSWHEGCRALPEPRVDVLMTHGPPAGILDANNGGHSCGDPSLLELLRSCPDAPRLHVFGHIHEAYGAQLCDFGDRRSLLLNVSNAAPPVPGMGWEVTYLAWPVTVIDMELPPLCSE